MQVSSSEIELTNFKLIFHVPLCAKGHGHTKFETLKERLRAKLRKDEWQKSKASFNFSETVYFHNFVRRFLYGMNLYGVNKGDSYSHIYERKEIDAQKPTVCVKVPYGQNQIESEIEFETKRHHIQIYNSGIAMLILELECIGQKYEGEQEVPITLATAQTVTNRLRRLYAPYYTGGSPQEIPESVTIKGTEYTEQKTEEQQEERLSRGYSSYIKDPYILEHWDEWLKPFDLNGYEPDWQIPSDERVPVMSYIELKEIENPRASMRQICDADWYRLAETDEANDNAHLYKYNPDFLAKSNEKYFFDRFYPADNTHDYIATRHIFGGAHYALVTVEGFSPIRGHFTGHYEKMARIVRFNHASLLAFSDRASLAVEEAKGNKRKLHKKLIGIRRDFLEFTHRFWFTGVSNQIQAIEMFNKWRNSLRLDELFKEVKDEVDSASDFTNAREANKLAFYAIACGIIIGIIGGSIVEIISSIFI